MNPMRGKKCRGSDLSQHMLAQILLQTRQEVERTYDLSAKIWASSPTGAVRLGCQSGKSLAEAQ